jgi:hypothetical protein
MADNMLIMGYVCQEIDKILRDVARGAIAADNSLSTSHPQNPRQQEYLKFFLTNHRREAPLS